jgi:hypothetical protein
MSEHDASGDKRKPSEAEREQIKLTASYLNGIAIGLILVGGLTIPSSLALNANSNIQRGVAAVLSLCSLVVSPYIHRYARRRLRGLDA